LNYNNLLGPVIMRFIFFALNLFFAVRVTSFSGWSFFSIIFAFFATRDFVHAVRLTQVYYHIKKNSQNKKNDKDK